MSKSVHIGISATGVLAGLVGMIGQYHVNPDAATWALCAFLWATTSLLNDLRRAA